MAMNPGADDTRLGCGRDIDEVWASMERVPDEHERSCPFCQEARASMSPLALATARMRSSDMADPDLVPDPGVLDRVMEVARAEARRGRLLPLDEPEPEEVTAELTVSEQTAAAVARRAADGVVGVQVRRSRVEVVPAGAERAPRPRPPDAGTDVGTGADPDAGPAGGPDSLRSRRPARVSISLQISVASTVPIPQTAQQVRQAVMEAIRNEVGVDPVVVDISVQDVHDV
jgi:hypothetical protein